MPAVLRELLKKSYRNGVQKADNGKEAVYGIGGNCGEKTTAYILCTPSL